MNRDDVYSRASALPIRLVEGEGKKCAYPQESGGGTWIGVNQNSVAFALLNWAISMPSPKLKSRGSVIPELLCSSSMGEADLMIGEMDLHGIWPFRLIGAFPSEQVLTEWRWDGAVVKSSVCVWKAEAWFSSGRSDAEASRVRRPVWTNMLAIDGQSDLGRTRGLHASHHPDSVPFSICVHRRDAGTLSYTEIVAHNKSVSISYSPKSPCEGIAFSSVVSFDCPAH